MSTLSPVMAKASAASYSSSRLSASARRSTDAAASASSSPMESASFRVLPVVVAAAFVVVVRADRRPDHLPNVAVRRRVRAVGESRYAGSSASSSGSGSEIVVLVVAVGDVASAAEDAGVGGHPRGRVGSGGVGNARGGESGSEVREHGARLGRGNARTWSSRCPRRGSAVARALCRRRGRVGARASSARRRSPRAARSGSASDTLHGGRVRAHHADTDARDGVRRAEVSHQARACCRETTVSASGRSDTVDIVRPPARPSQPRLSIRSAVSPSHPSRRRRITPTPATMAPAPIPQRGATGCPAHRGRPHASSSGALHGDDHGGAGGPEERSPPRARARHVPEPRARRAPRRRRGDPQAPASASPTRSAPTPCSARRASTSWSAPSSTAPPSRSTSRSPDSRSPSGEKDPIASAAHHPRDDRRARRTRPPPRHVHPNHPGPGRRRAARALAPHVHQAPVRRDLRADGARPRRRTFAGSRRPRRTTRRNASGSSTPDPHLHQVVARRHGQDRHARGGDGASHHQGRIRARTRSWCRFDATRIT